MQNCVDNSGVGPSKTSRKRPRVTTESFTDISPSCIRCREKKIKCDNELPKCHSCTKSGGTCEIVDSGSGKRYTRSQILAIQGRINHLLDTLHFHQIEVDAVFTKTNNVSANKGIPTAGSQKVKHTPRYIGDESGTGFIQYILQAIRQGWKDTNFTQQPPEAFSGPKLIDCPPHILPTPNEGAHLIDVYLSNFHIMHPFLERETVRGIYDRAYRDLSNEVDVTTFSRSKRRDLFQLNMMYALASIGPFRKGHSTRHPFGYFTAGLKYLDGILSFETIEDIQGFLLIARFGLYYYIGCSIWEISQICLRISVDLGLHKGSRDELLNDQKEDMRRRVFWECYLLDRFSSVTLGRPFGIEDSDISIGLPMDNDGQGDSQSGLYNHDIGGTSETTAFKSFIRLGQITSQIYGTFRFGMTGASHSDGDSGNTPLDLRFNAGDTYRIFQKFYAELLSWWQSCPVFSNPLCPAQSPEWFKFMYEREKLTLVRAAIDRVHSRFSFPPKELLNPCHNAAVAVIRLFDNMRKKDLVTYSWSYLQLMLSCGLSVIFCVFVKLDYRRRGSNNLNKDLLSNWWAAFEPTTFNEFSLEESSNAINLCADIQTWMGEQNKEMARYARFFNMMRRGIQEKIRQSQVDRTDRTSDLEHRHWQPQQVDTADQATQCQRYNLDTQEEVPSFHVNQYHEDRNNIVDVPTSDFLNQYRPTTIQNSGASIPEHNAESPVDWPSAGSENIFEPLVRQLFGTSAAPNDYQIMESMDSYDNIASWEFSQEPLLAEFASGLEGFMWEFSPP